MNFAKKPDIGAMQIEPFLLELAKLAADETLPHFRNLSNVDNKKSDGFDPVTIADQNAETAIRHRIMETFPEHGIEGEEFGVHQRDAEYCWVIDPIDGTRAFIAGIPVWGTLIALCRNRRPVAGIMSQPFTGEVFFSTGTNSWFAHGGKRTKIAARKTTSLADAIMMTTAPELFNEEQEPSFREIRDAVRMTRFGADCYAYCMLASGQIDLVMEAGLSFYDIAALVPIIQNAGGIITNWEGGELDGSGQVIATANAELHEAALQKIRR